MQLFCVRLGDKKRNPCHFYVCTGHILGDPTVRGLHAVRRVEDRIVRKGDETDVETRVRQGSCRDNNVGLKQ